MRAAVTLHIDAPPDTVWALVSDITRMGEYSPEVVEAEWIGGATGPAVGAQYRGHVRRNENWPILYWTTCTITECVPGQVFEFAVVMGERPVNTWRYEFRAVEGGGTEVTDSFGRGSISATCSPPLNESGQSPRLRKFLRRRRSSPHAVQLHTGATGAHPEKFGWRV